MTLRRLCPGLVPTACVLILFMACADEGEEASLEDAGAQAVTLDGASPPGDAVIAVEDAGSPADAGQSIVDAGRGAQRDAGEASGLGADAGRPADAGGAQGDAGRGGGEEAGLVDGGERGDAATGSCPARGQVSYTLQEKSAPSGAEQMAYTRIRAAMDQAIAKYNCYTNLARMVRVSYDPSVATADGNTNGNIRFGSEASMHFVTAMHELGHVFGVGAPEFKPLVRDGIFTGPTAQAEMRRLTGDPAATVKSDGTHFWPYGLNYVNEHKSEQDLIGHCAIVVAIREDLGP